MLADGDAYEGGWSEDKAEGDLGRYWYADGTRYVGGWKEDK